MELSAPHRPVAALPRSPPHSRRPAPLGEASAYGPTLPRQGEEGLRPASFATGLSHPRGPPAWKVPGKAPGRASWPASQVPHPPQEGETGRLSHSIPHNEADARSSPWEGLPEFVQTPNPERSEGSPGQRERSFAFAQDDTVGGRSGWHVVGTHVACCLVPQ